MSGHLCAYCRHVEGSDYLPLYKYSMMDVGSSLVPDLMAVGCTCDLAHEIDFGQVRTVTRTVIPQHVMRDLALAASAAVAAVVLVVVLGLWG
jgi:hypothetical protein